MALPNSFQQAGFYPPTQTMNNKVRLKSGQFLKQLLIGIDGPSDSGKTEFCMSAPGFVQAIFVDRNYGGVLDNQTPPAARNPNVAVKIISVPMEKAATLVDYQKYHADVRNAFYGALDNKDSQVVVMDGDSDWWELHILAHFGKTTQIYPSTRYAAPYAERRAINTRAFDSGKIVIMTNKVKATYETVLKPDGTPEKDSMGEDLRRPTGKMEPQGFKERDYLFGLWLHTMYRPKSTRQMGKRLVEVPGQWGVMITKCKHNKDLEGAELWGDDCNFKGVVELVYPEVPLERWGF